MIKRHGRLDGLVNNAGVGATAPALRTSTEAFARVIDLNLTAPFALSCLAAQQMRNGGGRSIVNVASVLGLRSIGEIPDAAYVASKAGMIGLTRELASQWGRYGIRVNAVAPGFFATEMNAELGDDPEAFPDFILSRTALNRGGRAGELDEAVLFLLGPGSSYVTGHVLSVDGGMAAADVDPAGGDERCHGTVATDVTSNQSHGPGLRRMTRDRHDGTKRSEILAAATQTLRPRRVRAHEVGRRRRGRRRRARRRSTTTSSPSSTAST